MHNRLNQYFLEINEVDREKRKLHLRLDFAPQKRTLEMSVPKDQIASFLSWLGLFPVDFWTKRENEAAEE